MGARVYLPTIGRFTSTDPVQGGNANAYVYVLDPVNGNDYSGRCFSLQGGSCNAASYLQPALTAAVLQPARTVTYYQAAKTFDRIQSSTAPRLTAVAAVTVPPRDNSRAMGVATVKKIDVTQLKNAPPITTPYYASSGSEHFSLLSAIGSAIDYYKAGSAAGTILGCGLGGAVTFETGGWGCLLAGPVLGQITGFAFGVWGFIEGGYGYPDAEKFSGMPDVPNPLTGE